MVEFLFCSCLYLENYFNLYLIEIMYKISVFGNLLTAVAKTSSYVEDFSNSEERYPIPPAGLHHRFFSNTKT